jgi:hypothetical protein
VNKLSTGDKLSWSVLTGYRRRKRFCSIYLDAIFELTNPTIAFNIVPPARPETRLLLSDAYLSILKLKIHLLKCAQGNWEKQDIDRDFRSSKIDAKNQMGREKQIQSEYRIN